MKLSDLKVGRSYDLESFGKSVHMGLDRYMGQMTYVFQSSYGKHFLLPSQVKIKETEADSHE